MRTKSARSAFLRSYHMLSILLANSAVVGQLQSRESVVAVAAVRIPRRKERRARASAPLEAKPGLKLP